MIHIGANGNKIAYGIKHYNLDTEADLNELNTFHLVPGTTVFIIETSESYILNGVKKWIKIKSSILSDGGTDNPDDNPGDGDTPDLDDTIIYDGGTP